MKEITYILVFITSISLNKVFSQEQDQNTQKKYYFTDARGDISLEIEILDLDNNSGYINILILDDNKREIAAATFLNIEGLRSRVTFDSLMPGKYAMQFYHDENQNNQIDFNLLGIPKEKYGSSNNVKPLLGPPKFEKMLIDISKNKKIVVKPVN